MDIDDDTHIAQVLTRAADVEPRTSRIVEQALQRGRVLRRRRRAAQRLSALGFAALIALAIIVLFIPGESSDNSHRDAAGQPSASTGASAPPTAGTTSSTAGTQSGGSGASGILHRMVASVIAQLPSATISNVEYTVAKGEATLLADDPDGGPVQVQLVLGPTQRKTRCSGASQAIPPPWNSAGSCITASAGRPGFIVQRFRGSGATPPITYAAYAIQTRALPGVMVRNARSSSERPTRTNPILSIEQLVTIVKTPGFGS